jgi:radical SAM-linked protein
LPQGIQPAPAEWGAPPGTVATRSGIVLPMEPWSRVRVVFGKRGRLRFLGQLDIGRTLERALRRSGVGARFTEGFNPRVRMAFPCASPTGMASSCEIVEIQVPAAAGAPEVRDRLAAALPADLPVLLVEPVPEGERILLAAATYEARERGEGALLPGAAAAAALLARETVPVDRRGKSVDLRPLLREVRRGPDALRIRIGFREGGATARPEDVVGALGADPRAFLYERIGMSARLTRTGEPDREVTYGA